MKQWIMLIVVLSLFFVVWGGVFYQIFLREDLYLDASLASEIFEEEKKRDLPTEDIINSRENTKENPIIHNSTKNTRKHTEKNNFLKPSLKEGIDFGEGVSIDDLLENYGVIMNN